jgi:hypothetical protein
MKRPRQCRTDLRDRRQAPHPSRAGSRDEFHSGTSRFSLQQITGRDRLSVRFRTKTKIKNPEHGPISDLVDSVLTPGAAGSFVNRSLGNVCIAPVVRKFFNFRMRRWPAIARWR